IEWPLAPMSKMGLSWQIIPAGLDVFEPDGRDFTVQAVIHYTLDGQPHTRRTVPEPITIYPAPSLRIDYEMPSPGTRCSSFYLSAYIRNEGLGTARNLRLDSAHPRLLNNQAGLPLSFTIVESYINGVSQGADLSLHLGNIPPGEVVQATWHISATMPGEFLSFSSEYRNANYYARPLKPLISEINTYFVRPEGEGCDLPAVPPDQTFSTEGNCECDPREFQHYARQRVNTYTGNYHYRHTDLAVRTIGGALEFRRSYNSLATGAVVHYAKPLGHGWTHNYDVNLIFAGEPGGETGKVIFQAPNGSRLRFTLPRNGGFQPQPGVRATLQEGEIAGSLVYTLTTVNQAIYLFDAQGQVQSFQDPQGNRTLFTYDGGQLTRVTDPTGTRWLDLSYTGDHLTSVTDQSTRGVAYGYTSGDLTSVTDVHGRTSAYVYTGTHLLAEHRSPTGKLLELTTYNGQSQVVRQEDGAGRSLLELTYLPQGLRVVTETGTVITDVYNYEGTLVGQIDARGHTTGYGLDGSYNRTRHTDSNLESTEMARTPMGLLTAITDTLGHRTTFTYDARQNPATLTNARGYTTSYQHDAQNNPTRITDTLGGTLTYTYNPDGQVTSQTDETGETTHYKYNALGQQTVITDATGAVTAFTYDPLGRPHTATDPLERVTLHDYDPAGNLLSVTRNLRTDPGSASLADANLLTSYEYDEVGRQVAMTDTLGRVTRQEYDEAGYLVSTVENELPGTAQNHLNEYNLVTRYGYDDVGRPVVVTDTLGHATRTAYDERGQTARTIQNYHDGVYDPLHPDQDLITSFGYEENGNRVVVTDTLGHATRTEYDEGYRVERTIQNYQDGTYDPLHPDQDLITSYTYDEVGNRLTLTNPLGRVTRLDYDELNRVITMTNALSHTVTYTYDAAGHRRTMTNEAHHTTHYGYDDLGRMDVVTDSLGGVTRTTFDQAGNRLTVTNAADRTTYYEYDSLNRMVVMTDALGHPTRYTYDAAGHRLTVTDAKGRVARSEYDRLGRLTRQIANYVEGAGSDSDTNVTTEYEYDALGQRTLVRDALGAETRYGYDAVGRTLIVTDALTHTTRYTYDALGNRLSETNGVDETTEFVYDQVGRLILVRDALAGETSYRYDAAGNQLRETDVMGIETRTTYDALDRPLVVTQSYQDGVYDAAHPDEDVTTSYHYDAVGNRLSVTDTLGHVMQMSYDELRRLRVLTNPLLQTTTYTYDATGNRLTMTDAAEHTTRYRYDELGRMTVVTDSLGGVTETEYDELGNRLRVIDAADRTTTFEYDGLNRMSVITNALGLTTSYTYDVLGSRLSVTDAEGRTTRSEYDDLGRLTRQIANYVTGLVGDNDTNVETDYDYDALGQRILVRDGRGGETHLVYDALGRTTVITDANGLASTFIYNARGNRLSQTNPAGETTTFAYDNLGRLILTEDALDHATHYGYDGLGSRTVLTDANGLQTRYEYDALRRLVGVIENYVDGTPSGAAEDVITRYGYD
ncbi:MAG: RHS repeat protein, partial [Ardenticatenales bacterium]|nr:RHS repeat protein [Ardenticatenales bacterium]